MNGDIGCGEPSAQRRVNCEGDAVRVSQRKVVNHLQVERANFEIRWQTFYASAIHPY